MRDWGNGRLVCAVIAAILLTGADVVKNQPAPGPGAPPPVTEQPPIVVKDPPPKPPAPVKPKPKPTAPPPAPAPAGGPSCRLGKADYAHLMSVKDRTLAACDNTDSFAKVRQCAAADQEWEAEFDRLCGPGSPGASGPEKLQSDLPDAEPTPEPAKIPHTPADQNQSVDPDAPDPSQPDQSIDTSRPTGPQCPQVEEPLARNADMKVDNYLDRVLMPLLLPGSYDQKTVLSPALAIAKLIWIIAHGMEEGLNIDGNPFNRQYVNEADAKTKGDECTWAPRKESHTFAEYEALKQKEPDEAAKWKLNDKGTGYVRTFKVCVPYFNSPGEAVNRYVEYLRTHNKNAYDALVGPSGTVSGYIAGLQGYGTDDNYKDVKDQLPSAVKLGGMFNGEYRRIRDYLNRRAKLLEVADGCQNGALAKERQLIDQARAAADAAVKATEDAATQRRNAAKP